MQGLEFVTTEPAVQTNRALSKDVDEGPEKAQSIGKRGPQDLLPLASSASLQTTETKLLLSQSQAILALYTPAHTPLWRGGQW